MELPTDIFRGLGNLRLVDLSRNFLRALPDMLFFEKGLEVLKVSGNHLSRVPVGSFSLDAAGTIVYLDVSDNDIVALHPSDVMAKFRVMFLEIF